MSTAPIIAAESAAWALTMKLPTTIVKAERSFFGPFPAIHQKSLNGIIHSIKDPRKQKKRCSQGRSHSAQPGVVGHILHKHAGHKHGTQTIYSRQRRCAETVSQRNCVRIFHTDRLEHSYPPCHFI